MRSWYAWPPWVVNIEMGDNMCRRKLKKTSELTNISSQYTLQWLYLGYRPPSISYKIPHLICFVF